jgi:hypothetical protein
MPQGRVRFNSDLSKVYTTVAVTTTLFSSACPHLTARYMHEAWYCDEDVVREASYSSKRLAAASDATAEPQRSPCKLERFVLDTCELLWPDICQDKILCSSIHGINTPPPLHPQANGFHQRTYSHPSA